MLSLSPAEEALLAQVVDRAVKLGLGGTGCLPRVPKSEDEAVLAVYGTLASFGPDWNTVLAPHGAKVVMQGAFIHQTPHVNFTDAAGGRKPCELGDLLLVVDDERPGHRSRQAVITQAKRASGSRIVLSGPGEHRQLDLNMRWPPFEFVPLDYDPSKTRDFRDPVALGHVSQSSAYGAIDIAGATWEQIVPSHAMLLGSGLSLAETVAKMVSGRDGRPAVLPPSLSTSCPDHWSEVIRLLLERSLTRTTTPRLGARKRAWAYFDVDPGGAGFIGGTWFVDDDERLGEDGADAPPVDREPGGEDGGGPMSVFRIAIRTSEADPRRD